jgi:hypothetical protein
MILHESLPTPSRAAASEFNLRTARTSGRVRATADDEARRTAAEQMRYQLYLLDRSQRRPSIEDCVAALLESGGGIEA